MRKLLLIMLVLIIFSNTYAAKEVITVGSKTFTEQFLIGKITTIMLAQKGYTVNEKSNLTTNIIRTALLKGEIDIYWEYTGTGYKEFLEPGILKIAESEEAKLAIKKRGAVIMRDSDQLFQIVKSLDYLNNGVIWISKTEVTNSWSLVTNKDISEEYQLDKISNLKGNFKQLKVGMIHPFFHRNDGWKALTNHYDLMNPPNRLLFKSHNAIFNNLNAKVINIGIVYETDPHIKEYDLVVLKDDKKFFPFYNLVPVVKEKVLQKYPDLEKTLQKISSLLTQQIMVELNHKVDFDEKPIEEVAYAWLVKQKLIK